MNSCVSNFETTEKSTLNKSVPVEKPMVLCFNYIREGVDPKTLR